MKHHGTVAAILTMTFMGIGLLAFTEFRGIENMAIGAFIGALGFGSAYRVATFE